MFHRQRFHMLALLLLIAVMLLSGCSTYFQPLAAAGTAPTPAVSGQKGGVENPDVLVDLPAFEAALLRAITARDSEKLQAWMTEPFLTGGWGSDLSDTPPADAAQALYAAHVGAEIRLEPIRDVDLKALLGGLDPLSIPRAEAGIVDAFLVGGWGKDGRDEAILFVARRPDNSLKWHGWMEIPGGFSGARLGGVQLYKNDAQGYSVYVPKSYTVTRQEGNTVVIMAPAPANAPRGLAYITVEPAKGRTAEQALEAAKSQFGPGFDVPVPEARAIDGTVGFTVTGLPGQDPNRQLFMVHGDRLYHLLFMPDDPQAGDAYRQMQDVYAMIVNTFHFTQ